ncbi:MAG TPA: CAP domain-containing protein [Trichocoleus sp.]|jgi:hypothetical protein
MTIEIFKDINFSGAASGKIDYDSAFVGEFWNDRISSIKVYSGVWEFFEHANFQGRSLCLEPGNYPEFGGDANDTISSFKRVANTAPPAPSATGVVQRVLDLTNIERRKANLPPLRFNAKLTAAAQKHSRNMAMQDFFDHRNLQQRAQAEGYPYPVGENIKGGGDTPEKAVQGWMNSPGHRKNILNPNYQELGVGYYFLENDPGQHRYQHYWTQCFGWPT